MSAQSQPNATPPARSWSRWRTLADAFDTGPDNFLLLRFIAATMVIYSHGYPLSGMHKTDIFVHAGLGADGGFIAVSMFFCISGFLVTGSLARWPNVLAFLKSRFLRLYPAFAVCLILCALVFGPLLTTLPLREYFRQDAVRTYVVGNLGMTSVHFVLPGVSFGSGSEHDVVNGSIWTLPGEASMYLWLAALGLLGIFRRTWLATCVLVIAIPIMLLQGANFPMLVADARYVPFACLFAIGSLAYLQRRFIPLGHAWMIGFLLLAWLLRNGIFYSYALAATEAYFCFWFAYCLPWNGFNRFGDYSYGIYLWGYPCEQLIVRWMDHPRPGQIAFFAFPLALAMAMMSWHVVEKPALRLKRIRLFPRMGIPRRDPGASAPDS